MWLAEWVAHGLIRASFVPPAALQDRRTLTRTRTQFVLEGTAHAQRIDKVLEDAKLRLGVVLGDILGKSGRAVLQFDRVDAHKTATRLIRRLEQVGYAVQVSPA
jgi:transposase